MAKFCANCGTPLNGTANFCPSCGAPVAGAVQPQQQPPQPARQPQQATQKPPMPQQGNQTMNSMGPQQGNRTAPPMGPQQSPPMQMRGNVPPQMPGGAPPAPQQQNFSQPQQMPPQGYPQRMQNPQPGRMMPQQPMMRGPQGQPMMGNPQGQPMMYQNMPGQNAGQMPYGGWPGQAGPNVPYGMGAAPGFGGAYVPDADVKQMFLRYDNRLNRKPYIIRSLIIFFAMLVLAVIVTLIGGRKYGNTLAGFVGLLAMVPSFMLMIRRLHDLDRPTWWCVGSFVPFLNMALGFYLLLAEGTRGPNQYGPDPLEGKH